MIAFEQEVQPVWVFEMDHDDLLDYSGPLKLQDYMRQRAIYQYTQAGNTLTKEAHYVYGMHTTGTPPDYFTGVYVWIYDHPNIKNACTIEVEYDKNYYGGNYFGVGNLVRFPMSADVVSNRSVAERFQKHTGLAAEHMLGWRLYSDED